jgi:hypothetical protein
LQKAGGTKPKRNLRQLKRESWRLPLLILSF